MKRISEQTVLDILTSLPLPTVLLRASERRQEIHPGRAVSYIVDTNPNYTNVCVTDCSFCSFYRPVGASDSYLLAPSEVADRGSAAQSRGATTMLLQGGHNPDVTIDYILDCIKTVTKTCPGMHLHWLSPGEIDSLAQTSGLSARATLQTLFDAGQRTMPGGGAEILSDRVRTKISPKKISANRWLEIMRIAHEIGFRTTATMTFGHAETVTEIVEHLRRLRELQDETGGFMSFIPWSMKMTSSERSRTRRAFESAHQYARVIAASRIYLDNFAHIQASWFSEGWRLGQLGLSAGADDFGGVILEENVMRSAGHRWQTGPETVERMIREAGFEPWQRNSLFESVSSPRHETLPAALPTFDRLPAA